MNLYWYLKWVVMTQCRYLNHNVMNEWKKQLEESEEDDQKKDTQNVITECSPIIDAVIVDLRVIIFGWHMISVLLVQSL